MELTPEETKYFETAGNVEPADVPRETPVEKPVEKPEDKVVPLAALHEARQIQKELREEAKRAQDEARLAREKAEKMEQTFQTFLAEKTKEAAPKYEEDPLGALKYENDQLRQQVEKISSGVQQTNEQWQKAQQHQSFAEKVMAQEAAYRQQAPDYDHAVAYLKKVRLDDYADLGFDPSQAQEALQNEILGLSNAALQKGKSPAEVAYKMAQRYGYKAQTTDKKLDTLAKGQEASKTLAGGKADAPLSLEALSQLNDEQLDALIKDDKAWARLAR